MFIPVAYPVHNAARAVGAGVIVGIIVRQRRP
jgi:hypothetical protein